MKLLERTGYPWVESDGGRALSKRPKQKNDCTVRAVALVFSLSYDKAYEMLKSAGRKSHDGFYINEWADEVLINGKRLRWQPFQAIKGQKRMNPVTFAQQFNKGRWIVRTAGHVFAFIDGVAYDDIREPDGRCIYGAWELVDA